MKTLTELKKGYIEKIGNLGKNKYCLWVTNNDGLHFSSLFDVKQAKQALLTQTEEFEKMMMDMFEKYDFIDKEIYEMEKKQNDKYTDGFREGRLYEREKVLKLIENLRLKYKGNSFISLIDEYSEELLSQLNSKEKKTR